MYLSNNRVENSNYITLKPVKYENINKNCNIIFVIDVSGSMNIIASGTNENGECDDLTRLNLSCHSILTIIESLKENDEIGIISFNHFANTELGMTKMNENGKNIAKIVIKKLEAGGTTNIYDGLKKSFELLKTIDNNNDNNNSIVLLTDGVSSSDPPNGILETLKNIFNNIDLKPFSLNTFGFGYDINSILLRDIANNYNGIFGFIPDCSMVGTVFINFISNLLTTYLMNIKMQIIYTNNEKKVINTGAIIYDGRRDFIIENENEIKSIELYYNNNLIDYTLLNDNNNNDNNQLSNKFRINIIKTINNLLNDSVVNTKNNEIIMNNLYNTIENTNDNIEIQNYLKDYLNDGQIKLALCHSTTYYNKWGKHYLLSLMHGYDRQLCINFKDNGVQNFITEPFTTIRDKIELIFCNIPPPQPKIIRATTTRISSMEGYYRTDMGCFDGEGNVLLSNNTFIQVKELKKGDKLFNMNNTLCIIECIIKQNINKEIDVCSVNDMLISPYHPIFLFNKWVFPATEFKIQKRFISSFYNVVLNTNDTIVINFIPVITLGHNLNTNIITKHDYFGTSKIRDDLKLIKGYNEGLIDCKQMQTIRCPVTNNVKKINIIFDTTDTTSNTTNNTTDTNNTITDTNNTSNITTTDTNNTTNNTTTDTNNIITDTTSNTTTTDTNNTSNITDTTSNITDTTSNTTNNTTDTNNTTTDTNNTSNITDTTSNNITTDTNNTTTDTTDTNNIITDTSNITNTSNITDTTSNTTDTNNTIINTNSIISDTTSNTSNTKDTTDTNNT